MTTRVLIVDDHLVVRQGLRQMLTLAPGFCIVGEAANGAELLERIGAAQADVARSPIS